MDLMGVDLKPGPTLIVSTRKGVFFLQRTELQGQNDWQLHEPLFLGQIINHAVLDPRDGKTMLASSSTGHLGPTVFRSEDAGASWREASRPPAFDKAGPGETPRSVSHTFWIEPAHGDQPGRWYAGTSPQALWCSDDAGDTWQSMRGFNDHPDYEIRTEDPQAGTPDGPVMHSIQVDPRDKTHMYLGLSGGGVYESLDGGESWHPLNKGMACANVEPDESGNEKAWGSPGWEEVGPHHDPHNFTMHPANPDILYQQNHCGIYRLERPDDVWQRIGSNMPSEIGDIGFVVGVHPRDVNTAWVFPMDGTDVWPRTSPGGKPAVYMTRDSGQTWIRQDGGLPDRGWFTVKRQCFSVEATEPTSLYFGTTSGEVWGSHDEGEHWHCLAAHLPEIYAVEVASIQ